MRLYLSDLSTLIWGDKSDFIRLIYKLCLSLKNRNSKKDMKLFIPKSHRVKHKILEFLSNERIKNGGSNRTKDYTFSLKEISKHINEKYDDVYSISDYLFYKKLVIFVKNDDEIENPFCWVSDDGIELFTSFSLINDGKLLNANLFNNCISGVFQIIVGIIAVLSILMNYQDSKIYNEKVSKLEQEVQLLKLNQSIVTKEKLKENNSSDTKKGYQKNIQTDDKK